MWKIQKGGQLHRNSLPPSSMGVPFPIGGGGGGGEGGGNRKEKGKFLLI